MHGEAENRPDFERTEVGDREDVPALEGHVRDGSEHDLDIYAYFA
jgi:hypothetical protein